MRQQSPVQGLCKHPFMAGILFLLLLSVYRQISLSFWEGDFLRPYVVYAGYLLLLLGWGDSVRERITQKNMQIFLCGQIGIMALWMTVRLAQEAWLYTDVRLMRYTGYLISVPAVLVPLFSLFASFGLGQWEHYRMNRRWYLLLVPAVGLIALVLTDPYHHLAYSVDPSEPQPNLLFHPYIGIWLIFGWVFCCMFLRAKIIYSKHRDNFRRRRGIRLAAFLEPLCILLFSLPYLLAAFVVKTELVEYSAGTFAIIAASWELYIRIGLVPVNTQYPQVFQISTMAMQILDEEGNGLIHSCHSEPLERSVFQRLRQDQAVLLPEGKEQNLNPISGGYVVWTKDVSQMLGVVEKLSDTVESLEKDSMLRRREIKLRSEEAALAEKSRLYDQLSREVGEQLTLLEEKLEQSIHTDDPRRLFQEICFIGTYIKRRSNLRLIAQEEGTLGREDMELMLRDIRSGLGDLHISCEICWKDPVIPSPRCFFRSMDALEEKLEEAEFMLRRVKIQYLDEEGFQLEFQIEDGKTEKVYGG